MIRYITNSHDFLNHLKEVLDYEIDYLSPKEGVLYLQPEDKPSLEVFFNQLETHNIKVTAIDCFDIDELSYACLKFAQRQFPQQITRMSKLLMLALYQQEEEIINLMKQLVRRIDNDSLEFMKAYIECHGQALLTAKQLFIHRNTVSNRLEQIKQQYGMDLKEDEQRICLDLMMTCA